MKPEPRQEVFIGIDVSKDALDIFISDGDRFLQFPNHLQGYKQLCRTLKKVSPTLIVLEASGGYEKRAASWIAAEGFPVSVVNPRQIRRYAQALGILAKTDQLDAQVLARFARDIRPQPRYLVDKDRDLLRALQTRRSQLVNERTRQLNQRDRVWCDDLLPSYDKIIQALDKELAEIESRIEQTIDSSPEWHQKTMLLKSMKGIGNESARTILTYLPELGSLDRRHISSLVGLTPFNKDSGRHVGGRSIKGGRGQVRKTLYMASLSAVSYNPVIGSFYSRLIANGKKEKVARVACMRKMLTILNAMARQNAAFVCQPARAA